MCIRDRYDARSKHDTAGFPGDPIYWESVIAITRYNGRELTGIELIPLCLGHGKPRPQRGRPFVARGEKAKKILEDIKRLSQPFETDVIIEGEKGVISLVR